jgi:hypothetical protein
MMLPLVSLESRENIIRIWQMVLPFPVVSEVHGVVRKVASSDWIELRRRIPGLSPKSGRAVHEADFPPNTFIASISHG